MFIIPTGLLREKSIATMISTVDKKFIESILNREFEFYKFNFKPSTWHDAVIIELLNIDEDILKSLYLLAFKEYEGFNS